MSSPTDDIHHQYAMLHCVCPECRSSGPIEQTCIGHVFTDLESAEDTNQAKCIECGWTGIVHDLLPISDEHEPSGEDAFPSTDGRSQVKS